MTKFISGVVGALVGAIVVLLIGAAGLGGGAQLGGLIENDNPIFTNGLRGGVAKVQVVNSSGQIVGPASWSTNTVTSTGDVVFSSFVQGGDVTTLTSTGTIAVTAANVCDSSVLTFSPTSVAATATLPTAATLYADCLQTNGDFKDIMFVNSSSTATTTILANTSSTLIGSGTSEDILTGNQYSKALIRFVRVSAAEMVVNVQRLLDAD